MNKAIELTSERLIVYGFAHLNILIHLLVISLACSLFITRNFHLF
jgi:hypothetical protein